MTCLRLTHSASILMLLGATLTGCGTSGPKPLGRFTLDEPVGAFAYTHGLLVANVVVYRSERALSNVLSVLSATTKDRLLELKSDTPIRFGVAGNELYVHRAKWVECYDLSMGRVNLIERYEYAVLDAFGGSVHLLLPDEVLDRRGKGIPALSGHGSKSRGWGACEGFFSHQGEIYHLHVHKDRTEVYKGASLYCELTRDVRGVVAYDYEEPYLVQAEMLLDKETQRISLLDVGSLRTRVHQTAPYQFSVSGDPMILDPMLLLSGSFDPRFSRFRLAFYALASRVFHVPEGRLMRPVLVLYNYHDGSLRVLDIPLKVQARYRDGVWLYYLCQEESDVRVYRFDRDSLLQNSEPLPNSNALAEVTPVLSE